MITAILPAGGSGERTGFAENKILRPLNGLPVLCYSLSAFEEEADELLIPCRKEDEEAIKKLLLPYPHARTVEGGATRAESVFHALQEAKGDIVLVHDAARPFVTKNIIQNCIESVKKYGSGVCSLPATDTTVLARDGCIAAVPPRGIVFTVQTPQGFLTDALRTAFYQAQAAGTLPSFTDESGIYAQYVAPPRLFPGEKGNRKLTFAEDFLPAERVGFGVDTHAFGKEQDYITLAGVKIPSKSGLLAHSDGDVLVHAVMDALLSAAGLRDIGYYFPDTDERLSGADSMQLLKEVMRLIGEQHLAPKNVSVSVLAERPRLSPYIETMKANLSAALALSPSEVGIAAGTNEKLGYVGEGRGITVCATALLKRAD